MILRITVRDFHNFGVPAAMTDYDIKRLFFDEADFYGVQKAELVVIREEGDEFRAGFDHSEGEWYENWEAMAAAFTEKTGFPAPGMSGTNSLFPDDEVSEAWEDFKYDWFEWERPKQKISYDDYVQCIKCPKCKNLKPLREWDKTGNCPDCGEVTVL
jgi:hypothetical protein